VGFPQIREEKKAGPVQDDRMAILLLPRLLFVFVGRGRRDVDEGHAPCQ
jgi:hypothetical protein